MSIVNGGKPHLPSVPQKFPPTLSKPFKKLPPAVIVIGAAALVSQAPNLAARVGSLIAPPRAATGAPRVIPQGDALPLDASKLVANDNASAIATLREEVNKLTRALEEGEAKKNLPVPLAPPAVAPHKEDGGGVAPPPPAPPPAASSGEGGDKVGAGVPPVHHPHHAAKPVPRKPLTARLHKPDNAASGLYGAAPDEAAPPRAARPIYQAQPAYPAPSYAPSVIPIPIPLPFGGHGGGWGGGWHRHMFGGWGGGFRRF